MSLFQSELMKSQVRTLLRVLDSVGTWLPQLALRFLLAHEFWTAGMAKLHGTNWFADIQAKFPFPFNHLPVEITWHLATWFELAGATALVLGIATRFFSFSLAVLTLVAIMSVHAGWGYNVCGQGWKLPLLYLIMFLPLIFSGPGKLSLDHWLRGQYVNSERRLWS